MLNRSLFICIIVLTGFYSNLLGQTVSGDSVNRIEGKIQQISHEDLEELHSPKKATLLSAVLPGAGQIYNKKYWKAPVIWAGIAGALYASQIARTNYQEYREEYILELGYPDTQSKYHDTGITLSYLKDNKNFYRVQMETAYVIAGAIYLLQILDANVDAQLMTFDVSDDLSLNVLPQAIPNQLRPSPTMGVTFALKFK